MLVVIFFADISPRAKEKKKINKPMGLPQTKKFLHRQEKINKVKGQPMEWENIFTDTLDKGLISKIYKELIKLNTKKTKHFK